MNRRTFLVQTSMTGIAGQRLFGAAGSALPPPQAGDLWSRGASELAEAIREGRVSSTEVIQAHLDRIEAINPKVNAVTALLSEEALRAAAEADRAISRGDQVGPLHGVPFTVKENIDVTGSATTQGVEALKANLAAADSPQVAQLREAGAIPIARTNLPDFGLRWHTESQLRGATLNPWNRSLTPGGSSGGEAAALATGMTPLGLGNDYGGSLRWPSQCCGTAALKPTTGRVADWIAGPTPPTLTIQLFAVQGPMARRVRDLRLALTCMSAPDPRDPGWTPAPLTGPPIKKPIKVAMSLRPGGLRLHPDVEAGVRKAGQALSERGYVVEELDPPGVDEATTLWQRQVVVEVSQLVLPEIGALVSGPAKGFLEAFLENSPPPDFRSYLNGWRERYAMESRWVAFQQEYPIVLGPVSTQPPFEAGLDVAGTEPMLEIAESMSLVVTVNLLGLPAAVVPTGVPGKVPQGVQLIGPRFREDLCLDAAEAVESTLGTFTPIEPGV